VCDPDAALQEALAARPAPGAGRQRRGMGSRAPGAAMATGKAGSWADADVQAAVEPVDERKFEKLRAWRWERAEGKPAYTVAANKVLEEVLRRRPQTLSELLQIRGIGDAFCDKHGESLLAAVAQLD
jgi:superfamily II DNA helicase RecQ